MKQRNLGKNGPKFHTPIGRGITMDVRGQIVAGCSYTFVVMAISMYPCKVVADPNGVYV